MKTSNRQLKGGSSGMHPDRRIKLESIRYDAGSIHPLSTKIYGEPKPSKELLDSIEKIGLLQPLIVNDTNDGAILLAGNTRREAWRLLYEQKRVKSIWIPCRFVKLSLLEAEQLVIESNRQREKTPEQKGREFTESKRIEVELAKQRMLAGVKPDPTAKRPQGQSAALAAARLGMDTNAAKKIEAVISAADNGDIKAQIALKAVNAGEISISAAWRQVTPEQKVKKKQEKSEQQTLAAELQKLFGKRAEVQSSKEGKFNLLFYRLEEKEVRRIAKIV